jgi:hypothetical protein
VNSPLPVSWDCLVDKRASKIIGAREAHLNIETMRLPYIAGLNSGFRVDFTRVMPPGTEVGIADRRVSPSRGR